MYEANDIVEFKETKQLFVVVAPTSNDYDNVVVWTTVDRKEVTVLPYKLVKRVEDKSIFNEGEGFLFLNITALSINNNESFTVSRTMSGVGIDALVSAYADLRKAVEDYAEVDIREIDQLIEDANK